MALVINIAITQIAIPIQSSLSGAGVYACEVGKTCRMVIQKQYLINSPMQDFVFLSRKKGYIMCISLQVYNKKR